MTVEILYQPKLPGVYWVHLLSPYLSRGNTVLVDENDNRLQICFWLCGYCRSVLMFPAAERGFVHNCINCEQFRI